MTKYTDLLPEQLLDDKQNDLVFRAYGYGSIRKNVVT